MNQIEELKNKDLKGFYVSGTLDQLIDQIEKEARSIVPDLTTDKGRKEIASLGRKIASSKVLLDNARKELTADWKAKAKKVDAVGKVARDRLDNLKEEIIKPLTDWRKAESDRLLAEQYAKEMDYDHDEANTMNGLFDREVEIAEKERVLQEKEAEAKRLQADQEEKERVEQEQHELEFRLKLEAEANAARKIQDDLESARKAKEEAENLSRQMKEGADLAERNRIYEEKQAKEKAEQEVQQARRRAKQRAEAEQERIRQANEAKAKNQAHRDQIHKEAVESLEHELGTDTIYNDKKALLIIKAIAEGKIKNVKIIY